MISFRPISPRRSPEPSHSPLGLPDLFCQSHSLLLHCRCYCIISPAFPTFPIMLGDLWVLFGVGLPRCFQHLCFLPRIRCTGVGLYPVRFFPIASTSAACPLSWFQSLQSSSLRRGVPGFRQSLLLPSPFPLRFFANPAYSYYSNPSSVLFSTRTSRHHSNLPVLFLLCFVPEARCIPSFCTSHLATHSQLHLPVSFPSASIVRPILPVAKRTCPLHPVDSNHLLSIPCCCLCDFVRRSRVPAEAKKPKENEKRYFERKFLGLLR